MNDSSGSKDIVKDFKDILEKGITYLKNIETSISNRIEILNSANKSLDRINSILENHFSKISKELLPKISFEMGNKIESLKPKVDKLSYVYKMIDDIVNQMKTGVKTYSIEDLLSKVRNLEQMDLTQLSVYEIEEAPTPIVKSSVKKEATISSKSSLTQPPKMASKTKEAAPATSEIGEDVTDVEMEGAKIFDEMIVGWKLRDWEKLGGTKKIFMTAWKKLSSYDKQKIRSGTWSKPIMKKVKLLGREQD